MNRSCPSVYFLCWLTSAWSGCQQGPQPQYTKKIIQIEDFCLKRAEKARGYLKELDFSAFLEELSGLDSLSTLYPNTICPPLYLSMKAKYYQRLKKIRCCSYDLSGGGAANQPVGDTDRARIRTTFQNSVCVIW